MQYNILFFCLQAAVGSRRCVLGWKRWFLVQVRMDVINVEMLKLLRSTNTTAIILIWLCIRTMKQTDLLFYAPLGLLARQRNANDSLRYCYWNCYRYSFLRLISRTRWSRKKLKSVMMKSCLIISTTSQLYQKTCVMSTVLVVVVVLTRTFYDFSFFCNKK